MISHFTGGNTMQPPEPVLSRAEWEASQLATVGTVPFSRAVIAARLLTRCGARAIIAAAAVQRAWFAEQRGECVTVPGAPDAFVSAVQRVLQDARKEDVDVSRV